MAGEVINIHVSIPYGPKKVIGITGLRTRAPALTEFRKPYRQTEWTLLAPIGELTQLLKLSGGCVTSVFDMTRHVARSLNLSATATTNLLAYFQ